MSFKQVAEVPFFHTKSKGGATFFRIIRSGCTRILVACSITIIRHIECAIIVINWNTFLMLFIPVIPVLASEIISHNWFTAVDFCVEVISRKAFIAAVLVWFTYLLFGQVISFRAFFILRLASDQGC